MTSEDWDEIFSWVTCAALEVLDAGAASASLDELEASCEVGYYDMLALCRERPEGLKSAGLRLEGSHLHRLQPQTEPEPTTPSDLHVGVDGQMFVPYTYSEEQCK